MTPPGGLREVALLEAHLVAMLLGAPHPGVHLVAMLLGAPHPGVHRAAVILETMETRSVAVSCFSLVFQRNPRLRVLNWEHHHHLVGSGHQCGYPTAARRPAEQPPGEIPGETLAEILGETWVAALQAEVHRQTKSRSVILARL